MMMTGMGIKEMKQVSPAERPLRQESPLRFLYPIVEHMRRWSESGNSEASSPFYAHNHQVVICFRHIVEIEQAPPDLEKQV